MPDPLHPAISARLASIGIREPDPTDPMHVRLVAALSGVVAQSVGAQLLAMRFEFVSRFQEAGAMHVRKRIAHKRYVAALVKRLREADPKLSRTAAKQEAEETDEALELEGDADAWKAEESAMRQWLQAMDAASRNHATDRADERATFIGRGQIPEQAT
ncbi:hypothetical protein [Clavibacter sp. VKM Ac-2872]|uniref:hypothetical protein n=1 Tax=Clavibacter sp. VKM Ac-2872 TaxID=2783812 RepID=UPI00188B4242|nr:hypothetical protein [Clavibacter sp. VKM Ac-2872]MBF4625516.1 hypothetical protein [Clavibacter sp. VKM Ac-2872]